MKLRTRLILSLLIVLLTSTLITFTVLRFSAQSLFRGYVFAGDREKSKIYASILGDFFLEKRSWAESQDFLSEIPGLLFEMLDERVHGSSPANSFLLPRDIAPLLTERIILADADGLIVADTSGELIGTVHPPRHLEEGAPVIADFHQVGTVLIGSMIDSSLTEPAEGFLSSMYRTFLFAGLVSAAASFFLGLFFTLRITGALTRLSHAAALVGSGKFDISLSEPGNDEVAELALAFNNMAEELGKLEDSKKRIIADSAHEIRTPLSLIQGTIEGMIDGIITADLEGLRSVHEETLRLVRLVDDLRELELIDSGRMELTIQDTDLGDLVGKASFLFQKAAQEKDIDLRLHLPETGTGFFACDSVRFGQVINNLLSNAIRHTPESGIISVSLDADERSGAAVLEVDDSGPGIPENERDKIFERFYRTDSARTTRDGGRGLGLSIAREIVLAHGGRISVGKSKLGGAAFQVVLPCRDSGIRKTPV